MPGRTRPSEGRRLLEALSDPGLATLMPFPLRTLLFAAATPARSSLLACTLTDGAPMPTGMDLSATNPTRSLRTSQTEDGSARLLVGGDCHATGKGGSVLSA